MGDETQAHWESPLAQSVRGVGFWDNMLVRILLGGASLALVISIVLFGFFIRPSETPIILHYSVYFGVDLLGIWWQVYVLPLLGLLFVMGHLFLAQRFYKKTERIACYLMLLSGGMLSFGLLVASVGIVFINY